MKKILVTGGSGTLGSCAALLLAKEFEVTATYNANQVFIKGCRTVPLDITQRDNVTKLLKLLIPDVVIHTAAATNPNFCETKKELAWKVNVEGTKNIAEACSEINAKMIYMSTNYIFDGEKGNYSEADIPNPMNYYAETKLEGEKTSEKPNLNLAIARTTPFGWSIVPDKPNFATWLIGKLRNGESIFALNDQFNSPIFSANCVEALALMIEKDAKGTFNIAGGERISRYAFVKKLAKTFGLDEQLTKPITCEQLLRKGVDKARRPRDTSLNVSKAVRELGFKPASVDEGLALMKQSKNSYYGGVHLENTCVDVAAR